MPEFLEMKAYLKANKITGASLARYFDKSPGWINDILRGNYPYYGACGMPRYLYNHIAELMRDAEQCVHPLAVTGSSTPKKSSERPMSKDAGQRDPDEARHSAHG